MHKLDTTLSEAQEMYRKMKQLADTASADGKSEVVKLRSRYAMKMLEILQTMKADERLQADPALRTEFEQRFFKVRQTLAEHQGKWRLQAIEERPARLPAFSAGVERRAG